MNSYQKTQHVVSPIRTTEDGIDENARNFQPTEMASYLN